MRLLFLHGPPASGKYTVGRELSELTGYELYHNHLVVDEVLKHHAFGTPGFIAERDRLWREHLLSSARDPRRRVIFTFSPENSVPQVFIDWLFTDLLQHGSTLHSIGLTLDEAAIEARLANDSRRRFSKLSDASLYRQLRAAGNFNTPTIPRTDLSLDTGQASPGETAQVIAQHFNL